MAASASLRGAAAVAGMPWPTSSPPRLLRPAAACPRASPWSLLPRLWAHEGSSRCCKLGLAAKRKKSDHIREPKTNLSPEKRDAILHGVEEYMRRVGRSSMELHALRTLFLDASMELLKTRFDIVQGARGEVLVSLRKAPEKEAENVDELAKRVARELFYKGGSADLHEITGRFGISKKKLLAHEGGEIFGAADGQLKLLGSAGAVAAAAFAAGTVSTLPGRRRRSNSALLTSAGAAMDPVAAERLKMRIEGLLVSTGDGSLPMAQVYSALGLEAVPALRRWMRNNSLEIMHCGNLKVQDQRLEYFQVRRAVTAAALVAEAGGVAKLDVVLTRVHRPPELAALEAEEQAVALRAEHRMRPPGGGFGHPEYGGDGSLLAGGALQGESLALAIRKPPEWVEEWVREFFDVDEEGETAMFPDDALVGVLNRKALPALPQMSVALALEASGEDVKPDALGFPNPDPFDFPDPFALPERAEMTIEEEEGLFMALEEELRLRYWRAHLSVLTGCFQGMKKRFVTRFFDITPYGDVVPKSVRRQTREAIAITRRATLSGGFSAEEAFREYGASNQWLRKYFILDEHGAISPDMDPKRMWTPPPEVRPPNPFKYARLDAPRGYHRKGRGGEQGYSRPEYGHFAGGILY